MGDVGAQVTTVVTMSLMVVSFPLALTLIKLFQMIDFLLYINVDLPINAQAFLSLFDQNVLTMIPNPLEVNEDKIQCTPHNVGLYNANYF